MGKLAEASEISKKLHSNGFSMTFACQLDRAKAHLRDRYTSEPTKTFGIVASSKSKNLISYGLDTSFNSRQTLSVIREQSLASWFNDPRNADLGCTSFSKIATEFHCQGLELDGVLLAWGSDFIWDGSKWCTPKFTARAKAKNPHQLRINSYRVLLTRSRDGFVIFCPPGPEMLQTKAALAAAGIEELA